MSMKISEAFTSFCSKVPSEMHKKQLTLVTKDGKLHTLQYEEHPCKDIIKDPSDEEKLVREGKFYTKSDRGKYIQIFKKGDLNAKWEAEVKDLFLHDRVFYVSSDKLDAFVKKVAQEVKFANEKKVRVKKRTPWITRSIHSFTGIVATPTEMLTGVALLAHSVTKVVLGSIALAGTKSAKKISEIFPEKINPEKIDRRNLSVQSFVSSSLRDVRIALLKIVPIIGAQLANQYIATGSLRGFVDAPAFGGLLAKIGVTIPKMVYGPRVLPFLRNWYVRNSSSYKFMNFHVKENELPPQIKKVKDFLDNVVRGLSLSRKERAQKGCSKKFLHKLDQMRKQVEKVEHQVSEIQTLILEQRHELALQGVKEVKTKLAAIKQFAGESESSQVEASKKLAEKASTEIGAIENVLQTISKKLQETITIRTAEYLRFENPTIPDTLKYVQDVLPSSSDSFSEGITVRIPTKEGARYHDGTLLLADSKDIGNKTVVIYHGNGEQRNCRWDLAQKYQRKGYNVLLASYAGDPVTEGKGSFSREVCTSCSEQAMIEDATADLKFLVHGKNWGSASSVK